MNERPTDEGLAPPGSPINWKDLCDVHPDPLMLLDGDHRVRYINQAQARALGCRPEAAVGRFCHELMHGSSGIPADCPHLAVKQGKATKTKEILSERLGGYFLVTVKGLCDEAGRLEGALHVARDMSMLPADDEAAGDRTGRGGVCSAELHNRLLFGRLLAELMYRLGPDVPFAALRENMRREVARIAETLGFDRCVCWEAEGGLLRQTACYARATATLPPLPGTRTRAEAQGFIPAPVHDGFLRSEADGITRCVAATAVTADTGELPAFVLQVECLERSPGRAFLFQNMLQVMCEGLSGILRHAAALEETHTLRRRLAQAEERTRLVQLAATLAHELNQPLAATLCNAQAALRLLQQTPPDLEEARSALADIVEGAHRAAAVIDNTRALFRRGAVQAVQAIQVERMAEAALALMRRELEAAGVTVARAFEPALPQVRGDEIHLQQVMVNLLQNALEAVREKPVSERRVEIRATRDAAAGRVVLRVSDSGDGIEAGQMERIFEPFHTTKPGGMGMGLPISRQIVEAMGGTIQATQAPGG